MGLSMAFLTIVYKQIALKFPSFFKLHYFTFLRTLKSSSNDTDSFASMVNEAAKAQTEVFTAEGYIDGRHTALWNFNPAIPVNIVKVKFFVNRFFNPTCVPMQVSINKLNFVPERLVAGRITVLRNSG